MSINIVFGACLYSVMIGLLDNGFLITHCIGNAIYSSVGAISYFIVYFKAKSVNSTK